MSVATTKALENVIFLIVHLSMHNTVFVIDFELDLCVEFVY